MRHSTGPKGEGSALDAVDADTRRGVVRLYRLNAEGKKHLDATGTAIAKEERRGRVRVTWKKPERIFFQQWSAFQARASRGPRLPIPQRQPPEVQ